LIKCTETLAEMIIITAIISYMSKHPKNPEANAVSYEYVFIAQNKS